MLGRPREAKIVAIRQLDHAFTKPDHVSADCGAEADLCKKQLVPYPQILLECAADIIQARLALATILNVVLAEERVVTADLHCVELNDLTV